MSDDLEGYSEFVGEWNPEADRAARIVEAAESAVEIVKLLADADFPEPEDQREFWAMVRELSPSP